MKAKCPIWGTFAEKIPTNLLGSEIDSPRAGGHYFISTSAAAMLESRSSEIKVLLTSWLVDQRRLGVQCPKITSDTLAEVALRHRVPVNERGDRILQLLERETAFAGEEISVDLESERCLEMLAHSGSTRREELEYLLDYLRTRSFISVQYVTDSAADIKVLMGGYSYLSELQRAQPSTTQAFVAMWFSDETQETRAAIKTAIEDAGYEPRVIDEKPHNNKIDDEIIAEIRRSRFVIADFTHGEKGMRGGVYYEAGFARGLGLEVISTCRQDLLDKNEIHFDTRQYNHIGWEKDKLEVFKKALSDRISATIGDGLLKNRP